MTHADRDVNTNVKDMIRGRTTEPRYFFGVFADFAEASSTARAF
jgi:hypothetical protein